MESCDQDLENAAKMLHIAFSSLRSQFITILSQGSKFRPIRS